MIKVNKVSLEYFAVCDMQQKGKMTSLLGNVVSRRVGAHFQLCCCSQGLANTEILELPPLVYTYVYVCMLRGEGDAGLWENE